MNRHLNLLAVITAVSCVGLFTAYGEAPDSTASNWKITAQTKKNAFTADEPIYLDVTLQNTSSETLSFPERSPQNEFKVQVKDHSGKIVPMTRFGNSYEEPSDNVFRQLIRSAKPGDGLVYHFWLNRTFDLTLDGSYTVTVSRQMTSGKSTTALTSNPVEFQVVEPNWSTDPDRSLTVPKTISP